MAQPKQGDRVKVDGWSEYYLVTRVGCHDGKPSIWLSDGYDGVNEEYRYPADLDWLFAHKWPVAA